MSKIEENADREVRVALQERERKVMRQAIRVLSLLKDCEPSVKDSALEAIANLDVCVTRNREFLRMLNDAGRYPESY